MEIFAYIPILLIAVAVPFFAMMAHNTLVAARNQTREAWGALDAALQRRYAFAAGFPELGALRDRCAANHGSISGRARDEREFVAALRSAIAADPERRAELAPLENSIQSSQRTYNEALRSYRRKCESLPGSLVASLFGFHPGAAFEVEPAIENFDLPR